jgi:hypothetical protein
MMPRSHAASLTLILATIVAGLAVRLAPLGLPPLVTKYGGSMLWSLTIYWIVSTVLPRLRLTPTALIAGTVAAAVELFKLYRSPGMDAFRTTLAGMLLLGRYFSMKDIVAYWIAIAVGALIDTRLRRRYSFVRD